MTGILILERPPVADQESDDTILVAVLWDGKKLSIKGKPGTVGEYAVVKFMNETSSLSDEARIEAYGGNSSYGRFQREVVDGEVGERYKEILRSWKLDK